MTFEELFEALSEIIKTQSDIIDSLYMRLAQILAVEELDSMPELEQMQRVVDLKGKYHE